MASSAYYITISPVTRTDWVSPSPAQKSTGNELSHNGPRSTRNLLLSIVIEPTHRG